MSWDTTGCFKAMCSAFSDFQRQPSEKNMQDLQRQIDLILGLTSHGATLNDFSPKQLIYAETLSALVSVINEPNLKSSLYLKSLMALSQLANNLETKLSLQNDFNLASTVVGFILGHSGHATNKQMVLQALVLLEKMSYGNSLKINNIFMVDLLTYLVKSIYITASEFCLPSLAVLANLCRNNVNVKVFVKTMSDSKQFIKVLLSYLSNSNKTFSITSLCILTSLYLNEALGENMFTGQNLFNMIRLAFKALTSNDDIATRCCSIDLIIDFVKCEKTRQVINENGMLETDINQILNLLHSTDAKTAVKIFELLNEFYQHKCLSRKVSYVFFKDIQVSAETQLADQAEFTPAQSLLHWISLSEQEDIIVKANILSLVFLRELFTEMISSNNINQLPLYTSQVFPILLRHLSVDANLEDAKQIKQRFCKVAAVYEIFSCVCTDSGMKEIVVGQIDFESVLNVLVKLLDRYSGDLKSMREPAFGCCQEICLLVFRGLELLSSLKCHFESGVVKYSLLIQNPNLIPLMSLALGSSTKFLVHASLQIIAEGFKIREFQSKTLGDTLLFHNASRLKDHFVSKQANESVTIHKPSAPLRDISNTLNKNSNFIQESATMNMLTEKLKKGLDMKDAKVSDLMDFYEHKLSVLKGQENHTQDLLEAKTATLVQTERLLAQYRCRHTESEAECSKLRSMLQTSERKCETNSVKISEYLNKIKKLDQNVISLNDQVKSLEAVAAEHEELRKAFEEQSQKLESAQKSLHLAQEEHNSLVSMNDCLMKNADMLKTKLDSANERIRELEEEKENLQGEIKEKEKGIKKLEKSVKDFRSKVASQESDIQGLEATLSEKENAISALHVELEKQSQISAMIHNLTMGKINLPNASSNTSK